MKTGIKILILIGAIILIIIALFIGSRIWLNYVWFAKLGFLNVFVTILWTKIWLWFTFFFIFVIFAGANLLAGFRKGNIPRVNVVYNVAEHFLKGKENIEAIEKIPRGISNSNFIVKTNKRSIILRFLPAVIHFSQIMESRRCHSDHDRGGISLPPFGGRFF